MRTSSTPRCLSWRDSRTCVALAPRPAAAGADVPGYSSPHPARTMHARRERSPRLRRRSGPVDSGLSIRRGSRRGTFERNQLPFVPASLDGRRERQSSAPEGPDRRRNGAGVPQHRAAHREWNDGASAAQVVQVDDTHVVLIPEFTSAEDADRCRQRDRQAVDARAHRPTACARPGAQLGRGHRLGNGDGLASPRTARCPRPVPGGLPPSPPVPNTCRRLVNYHADSTVRAAHRVSVTRIAAPLKRASSVRSW